MRLRLRLESSEPLSDSVRNLRFELLAPRVFDYAPGQAIDLLVPTASGLVLKRPYSIASAPGRAGPNRVDIAVTRVPAGPVSTALHALGVGSVLDAEGPRGGFLWPPEERNVPTLFIAAGTGLAPLRAMLQDELNRTNGPRLTLLFGCRGQPNILWARELTSWVDRIPRFELAVTLSRPDAAWTGLTGYVQNHVVHRVARLRPSLAFVCGLTPMIEQVSERLMTAGLPRRSIRTEDYGPV
ncbi:MAG: FAD-dependent oxidoreductase [Polyangiaceae bacterium]|nr:FAD-dependent oxidoreductase [Polyangiaceae bacterium]